MTKDLSDRLRMAATLEGRNVTDYVISTLEKATRETIDREQHIRLSERDAIAFVDALLDPEKSAAKLAHAYEKRRTLLGKD